MRLWLLLAFVAAAPAQADDAPAYFCQPSQRCWPSPDDWQALARKLSGPLVRPAPPPAGITSPFALQDQPGATESLGWLDAWTAAPSVYAVEAHGAGDIAAAIAFAHAHHLRVAIKGTGHDYLGRSTARDGLLIWTHAMRAITVHDAFVPRGCKVAAVPAVTVEAGVRWLEAYQEVTGKHGRYVQGGGCTSVGTTGGFLQGGGFGSWSNKYGIAAASLLEAEVVTADGTIVTANACDHADLFWALRGGGGGTFGVVTRATLRTYDLPATFGEMVGTITAHSDADYAELIRRIVRFYRTSLADEHWGEQITLHGDNTLDVAMSSQGLSADAQNKVWQPLRAWLDARRGKYDVALNAFAIPATAMWSYDVLARAHVVTGDPAHWWWTSNQDEVGKTWAAYQSRWITIDHFEGARADTLADALFEASRHHALSLHFNKGQAAAAADARARDREIAMNPQVLDAAALVIVADVGGPDRALAEQARASVVAAMKPIIAATPGAGSYVNETDYFEADWKRAFWGGNYARLLAIKHKYDPDGVLFCHHCVGSDEALARKR
ncbi:MAG TPA: FAD-binding protein [Kofleriaceae bacterium]|nr:FAD-binding protein [Kofleriaceae bacterium]